ncbi:hypothetical protein [Sphingobacterium corticibacter]|uniref:hypothetical protein n=1 Tax=Sphingobacterium corticibacter TaxID=2171749 RepID=UPI0013FD617B|nr:hypothetical protein [Sphingobacterium corticibacter]
MNNNPKRQNYESPAIEISYVSLETAIAAGSIIRENPNPQLTDLQDVETVDIWNF